MTLLDSLRRRPGWATHPDRLRSLHMLNVVIAILGVMYLLTLPFYRSSENTVREFAVAAAVLIFTVGAILGRIAEWKLKSVFFQPDIEKLMEGAKILLEEEDYQPADVPDISSMISALSLLGAFVFCFAVIVVGPQAQTAQSYWSAVAAVLVGEAIYLSWSFERVAMKAELEALARSWAKKPSFGQHAALSVAWAKRAYELKMVLGDYAFPPGHRASVPAKMPALREASTLEELRNARSLSPETSSPRSSRRRGPPWRSSKRART
jgi:hypothetical protein